MKFWGIPCDVAWVTAWIIHENFLGINFWNCLRAITAPQKSPMPIINSPQSLSFVFSMAPCIHYPAFSRIFDKAKYCCTEREIISSKQPAITSTTVTVVTLRTAFNTRQWTKDGTSITLPEFATRGREVLLTRKELCLCCYFLKNQRLNY